MLISFSAYAQNGLDASKLSKGVISVSDYTITKTGLIITATPRIASGLPFMSGADAATLINQAIVALSKQGQISFNGVFTINSSIIDNEVSGIILEFEPGAKLVAKNALNAPVIYLTNVNRWQIINPQIDGNAANQTTPTFSVNGSHGIWVHSGSNVTITNPDIYNARTTGVYFDGVCNNSGINGGTIHDCGWNCATLGEDENSTNLFVNNTECYNAGDVGISYYGKNCRINNVLVHDITGTTGYNNAGWGIAAETSGTASASSMVMNPTIYNCKVPINIAEGCNNTSIIGGMLSNWTNTENSYGAAIFIYGNSNTVQNTRIISSAPNGICITMAGNANYNKISDNYLTGFEGVNLDQNASYNSIINNWSKSSYAGINVNTANNIKNKISGNDNSESSYLDIADNGTSTIKANNVYKDGTIH